ncbi:MAG: hypothetical protein JRI64_07185, partial [Deltaproteobacteria bacterium]|nr:hypothetical protein [Deltaproteobacteria bacterium]
HLTACPVCVAEKDRLDRMLLQVGNMAKASAPAVVSRPVFLDRYSGFLKKWLFGVRPYVRIAVPALLILVIVTAALVLKPGQDMHIAFVEEQMIDPEQLLSDIDRLIENPLPQGLQAIVSFTEIDPDEDFMEYIVPVTENDPLSNIPGKKGENIC